MSKEIPLTQGHVALVDDEDYDRVMAAGSWSVHASPTNVYAKRNYWPDGQTGKCVTVLMHNFITGFKPVDHINLDGLDNRRCNLRFATRSQNVANVGLKSNNKSGFKGVTRHRAGQWRAQCQKQYLGLFSSPEEAARAYDAAAIAIFGEFARTNFPREDYL